MQRIIHACFFNSEAFLFSSWGNIIFQISATKLWRITGTLSGTIKRRWTTISALWPVPFWVVIVWCRIATISLLHGMGNICVSKVKENRRIIRIHGQSKIVHVHSFVFDWHMIGWGEGRSVKIIVTHTPIGHIVVVARFSRTTSSYRYTKTNKNHQCTKYIL